MIERLPLEPNLHAKRDIARWALEDAIAQLGGAPEGSELHRRRVASRPEPALVLYETDDAPARDPYVEIVAGAPPHPLNDALIVGEVAAATAAETHGDTRFALIELAAAKLDETAGIEATLEQPWGTDPVDTSRYDELMALPLDDRVEQLLGEGARGDEDPGV